MTWSGLPKRIEDKIIPEPNSGCWLWLGGLRDKKDGYGGFGWGGSRQAMIAEVAESILLAQRRGHRITYCEVSADEYREMRKEHSGGYWLGGFAVSGIPIRVRY